MTRDYPLATVADAGNNLKIASLSKNQEMPAEVALFQLQYQLNLLIFVWVEME